jgi:cystathionine beta-lyase/cystathionine gamma-synthase
LHAAERAVITTSGMGALAVALAAQLRSGDHVVVSRHSYGRSLALWMVEGKRLGIEATAVDTRDLVATAGAMTPRTKLLVVETISNPCLYVSDLPALADVAHRGGARLLVDNTFASPIVCRPLAWGADLVMESLTKVMSGHSDVVLGLLCGAAELWERVPTVIATWGLGGAPFECWLALRGLSTLAVRAERASANALALAEWLSTRPDVSRVRYPGLASHADHQLACRLFRERFGTIVTFEVRGGLRGAEQFIAAARRIPFCPSLGELSTTLSHPVSTSHRLLSDAEQGELGIGGGTIRLSVGIESPEFVIDAVAEGLAAVGAD